MRANDEILVIQAGLAVSYAAGGRLRQADRLLDQTLASAEEELDPADTSLAAILEFGANARFLIGGL